MVDLRENLMWRLKQNTQNKCTRKPSYGEMFCRSLTCRRNSMLLPFKRMAQFRLGVPPSHAGTVLILVVCSSNY